MKNSFIRVAAGIPDVCVADVTANTENIKNVISAAQNDDIDILVLPELCITSSTCGDLFFNDLLISRAKAAVCELALFTKSVSVAVIVGLPVLFDGKLFNCAAVLYKGEILQLIPKQNIPSSRFSTQNRYFSSACEMSFDSEVELNNKKIPFSNKNVVINDTKRKLEFAVVIGDDFNNTNACNIIINSAATNHTVGKSDLIKNKVITASKTNDCAYVFASAGIGESTTDTVYSGLGVIAQKGKLLCENKPFSNNQILCTDINISATSDCTDLPNIEVARIVDRNPFLPTNAEKKRFFEDVLQIQSYALARRLSHTYAKTAVIGISGGLDSTLALLVAVRAMKILNRPLKDVLAITMPCFGTTKRTRSNSEILCNALGVNFSEVNITESVKQHFKDIGQGLDDYSVTYENSQARERTQVLMDIANKTGGLVIGTGDLSELALGWATYNGDHMSMYAVNAGVPKTLIRYIVKYEADNSEITLKNVLYDILNTPVSPELLPADEQGEIAQKTEDLVGPYELHDFFLYHTVKNGMAPKELFELAKNVFTEYDSKTILYWQTTFTRRFFNQQFKRSCLPDGPKVFDFSLSPRGDWMMPSDAVSRIWLKELDEIKF